MKTSIRLLLSHVCLLIGVLPLAMAQQDAQFSQYMFRGLYFNPAVAGLDTDHLLLGLGHRSQWLGYDPTFDDGGAPTSQVFEVSAPLRTMSSGLGLLFALDKTGPLSSTQIKISYAYHLPLGQSGHRLSLGLRGGMYNQRIDFSQYRPRDTDDPILEPLLGQGALSQWQPDLGVGLHFSHPMYYASLSFDHLLGTTFDYETQFNVSSLDPHAYFMVGGNFEAGRAWAIAPSALLKTDFNSFSYDTHLMITYLDTYFVGGGVRASNALDAGIFMIGMNVLETRALRVSYSIDLVASGPEVKAPTSHEISLGYRLPLPYAALPPVIRTPRFRY
ncbi:MAG: type IX secretion system membrane protein PorP/SprF [Bernardetiaceae bacterium]